MLAHVNEARLEEQPRARALRQSRAHSASLSENSGFTSGPPGFHFHRFDAEKCNEASRLQYRVRIWPSSRLM